ncbi:pseudouridine synthase [Mycoplasma sp. 2704]|uniref:pseudouridine synthase n=1 Tax=unclassified Mycoplasma TaxID=2683645 RepID=UPI002B1D8D13|nr:MULTISPECIES: pseudouridine synthase [unclassified Mycoplasma]MEA4134400.1 pseudouridine synthase [Mycoplasma sp. 2704]MEA4333451.1 pseudouridine synthase [Mycoplasma sp. 1232]
MTRLDKWLSFNLNISRTDAKKLISSKRIKVDNKVVKSIINIINEEVCLDDKLIVPKQEFIYVLLNKPAHYVCANYDNLNKTVFELLDENINSYKDIHTVGRLDKDTTGLLLITNDGQLTHDLLSPKKHVEKTYYVEVDNKIHQNLITEFEKGFDIGDNEIVLPSKLQILSDNSANLTINEGKYHQVKRMFKHFDLTVTKLQRISFAFLDIKKETLQEGQFRYLNEDEILKLKNREY